MLRDDSCYAVEQNRSDLRIENAKKELKIVRMYPELFDHILVRDASRRRVWPSSG